MSSPSTSTTTTTTTTTTNNNNTHTVEDKKEIRKKEYKNLLTKYKNVEETNDFFKIQLQDLTARLKVEQKEKERLHEELQKARSDLCSKRITSPTHSSHSTTNTNTNTNSESNNNTINEGDITEKLKEAYKQLDDEFQFREQLAKDLDYTKTMLLAEEKVHIIFTLLFYY